MGHAPGFPCVVTDPQHEGRCQSIVIGPLPVDPDQTRYWEVTEQSGRRAYWRTNPTASSRCQVEHLHPDGWQTSRLYDSEAGFLRRIDESSRREITEGEVPGWLVS